MDKNLIKRVADRHQNQRHATYQPDAQVAKSILLKLFGERHADYGHGGYTFVTTMPRMGWDKVKTQLPRLLKDWREGNGYEDANEAEVIYKNMTSWITIVWNKRSDRVTVSTDDI